MALKKTTARDYDYAQPADEFAYDAKDVGSVPKGPLLGYIEVEKVVRDGRELRGSTEGGSIGDMVDSYFVELAKRNEEVREFKLMFGETAQFEQALKSTFLNTSDEDLAAISAGRYGRLVDEFRGR